MPFDPDAPLPGAPDPWAASEMPPRRDAPPFLMTEMIAAEPALAERLVERLTHEDGAAAGAISALAGAVRNALGHGDPVIVTGCGTSEHAAMGAAAMLAAAIEPRRSWQVQAVQALDIARHPPRSGLLIAVSHEGGTWATNEAIRRAREAGAMTALVTVSDRSPGAAQAGIVVTTGEQDQGWCHTVGYLSPLVAAAVLAGRLRGEQAVGPAIRALLAAGAGVEGAASDAAAALWSCRRLVVAGAGPDYPSARELALKIEEGCGLPATALHLETLRHGHLAACDRSTGLVVIATDGEPEGADLRERARAVLRSAAILEMRAAALVAPAVDAEIGGGLTPAGRLVTPDPGGLTATVGSLLGSAIPLQLLAERLARRFGRNPDAIGRDDARQEQAAEA
jgi:glucosamine--fructose-6-phosphate aminotransferase (isomerizing)